MPLIMRYLILLISFTIITGCSFKKNSSKEEPTSKISLSGNWKFNVIYGMGSNPLNILEQNSDIIIDNDDAKRVEIKGNWSTKKSGARGSVLYGKNYLSRNFTKDESKDNYVRYRPSIQKSGYYETLIRFPFSSHMTAQVNINHAEGITDKYVGQRNFCGQWLSLGIYKMDKDDDNYMEITAITENTVAADAVMFRPISEKDYLEAKEQPNQVYLPNYNDENWHDLKVPGHWGMINSFSNYNGLGWYRKEFVTPKNWNKNNKYRLKFDGVYHVAKVYLNGEYIGTHRGGFTPFEFDISDKLKLGTTNLLAVEADNSAKVGATWNWGGIIRDVYLLKNNVVRIQNQNIHATPDLEKGTAEINLKVIIENNSKETKKVNIHSQISKNEDLLTLHKTVSIDANSTGEFVLEGQLKAQNVDLWHFDNPVLYDLKTTITENKYVVDTKNNHFGIRIVEVTPSQLLLNGEPIRLGGFNRVSEHRFWGSSEPLEVLEKDVDLMKEAGANFMRIMHGTQNEKLIDLCDRKGILLFEEVNVRNLTNPEFTAPEYPLAKHWLKGMIERDWNHPSIIGWSVGNELSNHYEYAKTTMDFVRALDPNRLVTCVSNSGQKKHANRKTDPNTEVDLIMHNMYRWQGDPQEIIDKLRSEWPEKPIFISEYGFDPYPTTSLDGDQQIFSDWHQLWRGQNEFVIGTSLWTFNDYRSGYAATSQEENRVWGLINVWRQKRRMFSRVSKELSPIKDIQVHNLDLSKTKAKVTIPIRGLKDYPSYSLKNYTLKWTFQTKEGKTLQSNQFELPNLQPSQEIWEGEITWDKLPTDILDLKIQLISPTGYTRHEEIYSFTVPNAPKITQILPGDTSLRILFEKVAGASEYYVSFKTKDGVPKNSFKTISNAIELEGLSNSEVYECTVVAINQKGESKNGQAKLGVPNGKLLAPKIWDAFIADGKLVIGYTSEFDDTFYTVKYGTSKGNLNQTFRSNVRGMITIDVSDESPIFLQIKRETKGKTSNWSNIVTTKK